MKVLFLGAATSNHTLRWVNSLAARGHDILLVCRNDQRTSRDNIKIEETVKVCYLPFGGGVGYYLNVPYLKRIYSNFKPDVVNAHYATGYGTLARLANATPLVLSFWGSDIYEYPHKNAVNKYLLKKNLLYANCIAATSNAMAKEIKTVYPEIKKEIEVTPFGVDTEKFKPKHIPNGNRPVIGIVKYLEPIYDIPLLINAFSIVKTKTTLSPILRIYGGGSLQKELKKLCIDLGVEKDVTFFGTIPNSSIPEALNQMDVFVNCSLRESFGVALVEAMACEVPVIATDTDGYREVVENGVTGIIVQDRDPASLANAIIEVLSDLDYAKSLGANGRKRVLKLYDWNLNVTRMETLYKNVAGQCR